MNDIFWSGLSNTWLVLLVAVSAGVILYRKVWFQCAVFKRLGAHTSALRGHGSSRIKIIIKAALLFGAILASSLALLRPQRYGHDEVVSQHGRDVLIAVDVSRSMLAQDCQPSRLELTKKKIRNLVHRLPSDRVGLILFSGSACVQCPLTTDHAVFSMFLDALDVETISSGSTALDSAIKQALAVFQAVPSKKNKLLVLFTDGEDFSTNLAGVKDSAQQEGMTIFTMGVGTADGAPIPLFDEKGKQIGHQKDKKGAVVISRLNESVLQELARMTGGFYAPVNASDDRDIMQLVQKVLSYEKEQLEDKKIKHAHDLYHWFLLVSFICLACEWML